jgi:hypothetical protein
VEPTGAVKLVMDVGKMVTGALPEPVRVIVCGVPVASSATVSAAVLVPDAVGAKVTCTQQSVVAGSDEGGTGHEDVTPKSLLFVPVIVIEVMLSAIFCSFVKVTIFAALVVPRYWASNVSEPGESITCGIALALRANVCEPPGALSAMVMVPGSEPVPVAFKLTAIAQLPPVGTVSGDSGQVVPLSCV